MELKKINEETVKAIKLETQKGAEIKGENLFDIEFFNLFVCSKKRSGKTNLIFHILKKLYNPKRSHIIICSSTVSKDKNWIQILDYFEKHYKEPSIHTYTSIAEDNVVAELMDMCSNDKDDKDDYLLVIDDLSQELSKPIISVLLKKNRHLRMKVILSSQYWNDLDKQARLQLDYIFIFPNIPEEKLKLIHKESDLSIEYEDFKSMYRTATEKQYNFFYINARTEEFRKNFDQQFLKPAPSNIVNGEET